MNNMHIQIPYGKGVLKFSLPRKRVLGILKNKKGKLSYSGALSSRSFDKLEKLVNGKDKILIVVPDITRHAHLKTILPRLLKRIDNNSRAITIIVATGLHKKHDAAQLNELVGRKILARCKVISHDQDKDSLTSFGRTKDGIPIVLNKNLKEHDFIVSIGVIEPHLYAGYSGGVKTIAIGLAGADTVNATHSIGFLDNPLTKIGSIVDNPFQNALSEIASKVPIGFSINIVNDSEGKIAAVFSGRVRDVFKNGIRRSRNIFEVNAAHPADIVICGIGYPKDINLYQASRAINYIVNVDKPILKKGGVLIIAAELKEGVGTSVAEHRFYDILKNMRSPEDFMNRIKKSGCIVGEHRAYMVARPLLDYKIIFATRSGKELMRDLPFPCFNDINEALGLADKMLGSESKIYIVPRALSTIARISGKR